MSEAVDLAEHRGWWFPTPRAAHWADGEGRSLCLRWTAFGMPAGAFENDGGERTSSDECKACRRKLNALRGTP